MSLMNFVKLFHTNTPQCFTECFWQLVLACIVCTFEDDLVLYL